MTYKWWRGVAYQLLWGHFIFYTTQIIGQLVFTKCVYGIVANVRSMTIFFFYIR